MATTSKLPPYLTPTRTDAAGIASPKLPEEVCVAPLNKTDYFSTNNRPHQFFFDNSRGQRFTLFQEIFSIVQANYRDGAFQGYIKKNYPDWKLSKIDPHSNPYARNYAFEITLPNQQKVFVEKYEETLVIEFSAPDNREVVLYTTESHLPSEVNWRLTAVDAPGFRNFAAGHHIHVYDHKLGRWTATIALDSQPNTRQVSRFLEDLVKSRNDWESNHQHLVFATKDPRSTFDADHQELLEKVEKEYQSSEVSDSHLYRFKDESHGGEYLLNLAKSALAKGYTPSQILNFRFFTRDSEITFRELLEQQRFRLVITTDGGFPLMRYQQYSSIGYPQFVDQDSYQFLLLLMKLTPSSEWKKPWNGFTKQNLSIDHILKKVEEAYKNDEFYSGEHDVFHFTEVLLTYSQGSGKDPNQLKKRFLERETKKTIKSNNVTKIAHQMESLGLLLNAPEITWTQEEQKQVQDWIAKVNQWTARANLTELFDSEVIHLYKGYTLIQKSPHAWAKK